MPSRLLGKVMQAEAKPQVTQPKFYLQLAVFLGLNLAPEMALGDYWLLGLNCFALGWSFII